MYFFKRQTLRNRNDQRTNAAELTLRESLYPLILVTILCFLWGFSYGLIHILSKHFQDTVGVSRSLSSWLYVAYFGAYPLASLGHANWILRHYGYKATFIWGLTLYAVGSFIAWPCLQFRSFGGFCGVAFVIGNGLGALETAANPYLAVCGPPRYSEIRINIAQAFNGIGTVLAPVLGSYVVLNTIDNNQASWKNIQGINLAIGCFCIPLAAVFYFSNIPEITDADTEFQAESTRAGTDIKPFRKQYGLFHAAIAQFCSTGAQVAIAGAFINYIIETRLEANKPTPVDNAARILAGAQVIFTLGRFAGSTLMFVVKPRWVLFIFMAACMIFMASAISGRGDTGMIMIVFVLFCESISFPTIVALGMRGLGKYSKRGSGFIVAGVGGGAIVPPLLFLFSDNVDAQHPIALALTVPLAFLSVAWSYPVLVNLLLAYRHVADSFWTTESGVSSAHTNDGENQIELTGDGVLAKNETAAPTVAADGGGRAQDESQVEVNGQPDDPGVAENQDDRRAQPESLVQDNGQGEDPGVADNQVEGMRRPSSHYSTTTNGNPTPSPENRSAPTRQTNEEADQSEGPVLEPNNEPEIWQRLRAQLANGPFVKTVHDEVEV